MSAYRTLGTLRDYDYEAALRDAHRLILERALAVEQARLDREDFARCVVPRTAHLLRWLLLA